MLPCRVNILLSGEITYFLGGFIVGCQGVFNAIAVLYPSIGRRVRKLIAHLRKPTTLEVVDLEEL